MIRSFRDKALERFFATGEARRLSVQNTKRIANILRAFDDASRPEDMNLPGFVFMHSSAATEVALRSMQAEIGESRSAGLKAMPLMSICRIIIEGRVR